MKEILDDIDFTRNKRTQQATKANQNNTGTLNDDVVSYLGMQLNS